MTACRKPDNASSLDPHSGILHTNTTSHVGQRALHHWRCPAPARLVPLRPGRDFGFPTRRLPSVLRTDVEWLHRSTRCHLCWLDSLASPPVFRWSAENWWRMPGAPAVLSPSCVSPNMLYRSRMTLSAVSPTNRRRACVGRPSSPDKSERPK